MRLPIVVALCLIALPAAAQAQQVPAQPEAQQAQQVDQRIAVQLVNALQTRVAALDALVKLRESEIAAMVQDNAKRIAELEAKCGEPCLSVPR